jgi:DNA-binding SARP family transcriptional activator
MAGTTTTARRSSSRTLSRVDPSELVVPIAVRIDLLGPLRLYVDDREVIVPALRPRALLGLLAIRANAVVQSDRLIDELWDGVVTPGAAVTLRSYISVLRRALSGARTGADSVLATAAAGYRIDLEAEHIDAHRLRRLVGEGHEHLRRASPHEALGSFETALGLWRGLPLAELGDHTVAAPFRAEMAALRASATDGRLRALVEAGRHHEAIPDLESLIRTEPLREEPYELMVLALYRAGRTPEALDVHGRFRALLREQLGIDPSPAFAALQSAVLTQDPRLDQVAAKASPIQMPAPGLQHGAAPNELMGALIDALHAVADALAARVPSTEVELAQIVPLAAALGVAYDAPSTPAAPWSRHSWRGAGRPNPVLNSFAREESLSAC